ncbi:GreA/GreB family elongation factor [Patescibacteria group bacterium]|nr:GreA/GreB family elongation factor [Patescibacteria group bacterium]
MKYLINKIMEINKQKLFKILKERVEKEISTIEKAFNDAVRDFKDAPGPMESASDTTRSEKDRIQAIYQQKLDELKKSILELEKLVFVDSDIVIKGSLVICKNPDQQIYWIVNIGIGDDIKINDQEIMIISDKSPLGLSLLGKRKGDVVKFGIDSNRKKIEIVDVI